MIELKLILIAALSMGGIGLILAIGLVFADKKFKVQVDEKLEKISEALPGVNCGACGYPGCAGLAEAIYKGERPVNACPVGGADVARTIAGIMGVEGADVQSNKVVLLCQGGQEEAAKSKRYLGIRSCTAAQVAGGGEKTCTFGCIGHGDCVSICPFNAISIGGNGLPVIDRDKCTGCGKCVDACPRHLLQLYDEKTRVFVYCKSTDKGAVCRKYCSKACIGCGICAKECKFEAITIQNNLAVIDYSKCKNCGLCTKKCPTGAIGQIMKKK